LDGVSNKEYPPQDVELFEREKQESKGFVVGVKDILISFQNMPKTMKQLAIVQFFSWFALFCMWIYTTSAVTSHIYKATDPTSTLYNEGADWVGVLFAAYNGFAAVAAFLLPVIAKKDVQKNSSYDFTG